MPANEFEKQVQQQLEEFQLNPSASVWKNVEKEIREKKRKRIIFFFILPTAIALLVFLGYYFMSNNPKNEIAQQTVSTKKTEENSDKKQIPEQQKDSKDQPVIIQKDNSTEVNSNAKKPNSTLLVEPGKNNLEVTVSEPAVSKKRKTTTERKAVKEDHTETVQDNSLVIDNNIPAPLKPVTSEENKPANKTIEPVAADQKTNAIVNDQIAVKTDSAVTKDIVKNEVPEKILPKKNPGKNKIKWGIDLAAGITSNQDQPFSLLKSVADVSAINGGPQSTPGGVQPVVPPSSVKPGFSFRIGLTGDLKISGRSSFSTGLQYVYASNRIKTGSAVDTTLRLQLNSSYSSLQVDRIYKGGQKNVHTNSYHFVSIPVTYHWLISKKLPLQWNAGLSFNYLLATNALIYSSSLGGIYYQDKKAFNKMHVAISTGLSWRLKGKKGMEWMIGPELSFDTRRLVNNNDRQYLLFGGINTQLFFSKKKK